MSLTPDHLDKIRVVIHDAISFKDLARLEWRRQTDVVKEAFVTAAMFADLGPRALFVDGHMSRAAMARLRPRENVKAHINRRCHDYGLTMRRMIFLDTVTTGNMGGREVSLDKLHFHGVIELPIGWSRQHLLDVLGRVFGRAPELGQRQFHLSTANYKEHFTFNGVRANGPLGKMLYGIKHAGPTYRLMGLNDDGKRSRRAPASRGRDNRNSKRLARGVPSHFNSSIVLCDNVAKAAGRNAFEAWVDAERVRDQHPVVPLQEMPKPDTNKRRA